MSEYTPKTKDVREAYIDDQMRGEFGRLMGETPGEFDRWLASVKAEAWDEGVMAEENRKVAESVGPNPYQGEQT